LIIILINILIYPDFKLVMDATEKMNDNKISLNFRLIFPIL